MSWWDIIKVQETFDVGYEPTRPISEGGTKHRTSMFGAKGLKQRAAETEQTMANPNLAAGKSLGTLDEFEEPQTQQQQVTNDDTAVTAVAADSGDAGSDVGQTIGRIKQHLARNPQGAKGIKTLPIIEKLILASQNPTAYQQEVKDAVKQLKKLVPTAV